MQRLAVEPIERLFLPTSLVTYPALRIRLSGRRNYNVFTVNRCIEGVIALQRHHVCMTSTRDIAMRSLYRHRGIVERRVRM